VISSSISCRQPCQCPPHKNVAVAFAAGEDLLVASADKPFRFPATFTFVVRSFTVLDGIGKSLNPRFDISEIAAPYARGLLLEARPQFAQLFKEFRKRAGKQARRSARMNPCWRRKTPVACMCCTLHQVALGSSFVLNQC
jgi:predicted unusual protein kinase regulating ubiquinone biosynthesis (AarF/ABC1/UbiB family)